MTVRHEIAGRSASSGEATLCVAMAEDEGFEPSKGCPLHAFQACALGRYANPPAKPSGSEGQGYRRREVGFTQILRAALPH